MTRFDMTNTKVAGKHLEEVIFLLHSGTCGEANQMRETEEER